MGQKNLGKIFLKGDSASNPVPKRGVPPTFLLRGVNI